MSWRRIGALPGGGGILICVKNYIDCRMLWIDEVFEIMAVDVKDGNSKVVWEVVRSLQSSKLGHAGIERLAARTGFTGNPTKRSIMRVYIFLPYAERNGNTGGNSGNQALINNLVCKTVYSRHRGLYRKDHYRRDRKAQYV